MKKIVRLCALCCLMLALAACTGDPEDHPIPTPDPEQPTPPDAPDNPDAPDDPGGEPQLVVAEPDAWDGTKRADLSYQLLIYSFADSNGDGIGDFNGITAKLDYFDALGVSALWLSPAHPAASYHGYDVKDYTALNPQYGTEEEFKNLIDQAHAHGIKIYMDWVINHTSKEHPWFLDVLADPASPYRDYYVLSTDPQRDIAAGRIPMINTEGAAGYDPGQWFAAATAQAGEQKLRFTLQWGASPTLTVEQVETIENTGTPATDRFLYYGDGKLAPFYAQGGDRYTLSLAFESSWGCLVRTSDSSWATGTKYGAAAGSNTLAWGEPLTLRASAAGYDPADILLSGAELLMYHSHFWTDWFVDLDYGAAATCEQSPAFGAICDAAKKWIDLGIDGLRLDGAKHIYHNAASDENPTFWNKFYTTLDDYYRAQGRAGRFYMVGEVYDDYEAAKPYYKGLPALFEFAFWYRLEWALNNATGCYFAKDIASYRTGYEAVRSDYIAASKLTNHDENRARSLLGGSLEKAKLAGVVLLTANGSPYIYYGEELGYVGIKDNKGDEYVRNPMKWGDSYTTTFIRQADAGMADVADVAAQSADEASILQLYRTFGALRNTYPALATGAMSVHPLYNGNNAQYGSIAAWYMTEGTQQLLVVHNFGAKAVTLPIGDSVDKAVGVLGTVKAAAQRGDTFELTLDPYASVVYLLK